MTFAPLFVKKKWNKLKNGNRPHWNRKGNGSDSALYLRQQLQFYHLSKDSARYNSQQFSSFRDSMKNTVLGRALGKNSRAVQMSRSSLNNFDQNVMTVEPILNKHFADSALTKSELDQLRQIAVLCPYTEGIAVYQARRVLHEFGDRLLVNECEISNTDQSGASKVRIKVSDSSNFAITIFPNPTNQSTNLYFETSKEGTFSIEIIDLIGKCIKLKSVLPNINNNFDVSEMQSGVYFIRLFEEDKLIQTQKLVVQ